MKKHEIERKDVSSRAACHESLSPQDHTDMSSVSRCHSLSLCLSLLQMDDERELIKMILRYIGVLHDVKATEKSIAAGGRDSVKDSVPPPSRPHLSSSRA